VSEPRIPFLHDPHLLAFLEDPHHYVLHLAKCLATVLETLDQIEETRLLDQFRRRVAEMGILNCECEGLSAADEVRLTLSISNEKALEWARSCIALGITSAADPANPDTVLDRLRWPVQPECKELGFEKDAP
jgi:hypothetical protein